MEKSSEHLSIPGELDYLRSRRAIVSPVGARREMDWSSRQGPMPSLSQSATNRLRKIVHAELHGGDLYIAQPEWLNGQAVPRLIVTAKYTGQDAFGSSRLLADLDLAARRAAALHRQMLQRREIEKWPSALRSHQGGLYLLNARMGSFEVLLTVWGSLVSIAGSSPIAVASLMALAWDVGRGTARIANRWVGASLTKVHQKQPVLESPIQALQWGVQHTKALAPVMQDAIENDQGFEFFLNENDHQIKLTVPPNVRAKSSNE